MTKIKQSWKKIANIFGLFVLVLIALSSLFICSSCGEPEGNPSSTTHEGQVSGNEPADDETEGNDF